MKISKQYIALNSETYINLHTLELDTCKRIGYEYYWKEEHIGEERDKLNPKFSSFLNSFMIDIFLSVAALVTILATLVVIYVVCSHSKLKTLVANLM